MWVSITFSFFSLWVTVTFSRDGDKIGEDPFPRYRRTGNFAHCEKWEMAGFQTEADDRQGELLQS